MLFGKIKKIFLFCLCIGCLFTNPVITKAASTDTAPILYQGETSEKTGATRLWWEYSDSLTGDNIRYEVEYANNSKFKAAVKKEIKKNEIIINKKYFGANGGRLFFRIRAIIHTETGKTSYSSWSNSKPLVFVKINKKNFPGMYTTLKNGDGTVYQIDDKGIKDPDKLNELLQSGKLKFKKAKQTYDKNKDGWLDPQEINQLTSLITDKTKISSLTGVSYFTNLERINLKEYSGTKINLSKNKINSLFVRGIKAKSITVIAPDTKDIFLEALSKNSKLSKIDVSTCKNTVKLSAGRWGTPKVTIKLPTKSKKLKSLSLRGINKKVIDVNAYTNLLELDILGCNLSELKLSKCKNLKYLYFYSCNKIRSLNLSQNTKLKYADFYATKGLSINAVKKPKSAKVTVGKGSYWFKTKEYQKDMKNL